MRILFDRRATNSIVFTLSLCTGIIKSPVKCRWEIFLWSDDDNEKKWRIRTSSINDKLSIISPQAKCYELRNSSKIKTIQISVVPIVWIELLLKMMIVLSLTSNSKQNCQRHMQIFESTARKMDISFPCLCINWAKMSGASQLPLDYSIQPNNVNYSLILHGYARLWLLIKISWMTQAANRNQRISNRTSIQTCIVIIYRFTVYTKPAPGGNECSFAVWWGKTSVSNGEIPLITGRVQGQSNGNRRQLPMRLVRE